MKNIIATIMCMVMVLSLVGCGGGATKTETATETESTEVVKEGVSNETATEVKSTEVAKEGVSNETSGTEIEWKQFLKEYSKWADDYIEFIKKYKANPTDLSLLGKYAGMVADVAKWAEKADDMSDSLSKASPKDMAEYTAELLKISKKLAEAAY